MYWVGVKIAISAAVIVLVSEIAGRSPRLGSLILTLPLVSILAFVMTWTKDGDNAVVRQLARETLVLVPLGLPFFVPFAISDRTRMSFWPCFMLGLALSATTIGIWMKLGPSASAQAISDPENSASRTNPRD